MMHIGLMALDERPVNMRYPKMVADIAGVELVQPPLDMLNHRHEPADWLRQQAVDLDALVVALAMLRYGGLIPSRTTRDSAMTVLNRLELLRSLKRQPPRLST